MADALVLMLKWSWIGYQYLMAVLGLFLIVAAVFRALHWAAEKVLLTAVLVEAVVEARKQGRAPILKAFRFLFISKDNP